MKFTLSWLKQHLETTASAQEIVDAMTMAGLEVEHVENPAQKLAAFTVARIVSAEQHPNADRLRVCQVDTVDGRKEIVCGALQAINGQRMKPNGECSRERIPLMIFCWLTTRVSAGDESDSQLSNDAAGVPASRKAAAGGTSKT